MTSISFSSALLLFIVLVLFTSCDCIQDARGIVIDKETGRVIEGAYVQKANENQCHSYTNNRGEFELSSISGGFRKCPPMSVSITKLQYEIKTVEVQNGANDTIYLAKID